MTVQVVDDSEVSGTIYQSKLRGRKWHFVMAGCTFAQAPTFIRADVQGYKYIWKSHNGGEGKPFTPVGEIKSVQHKNIFVILDTQKCVHDTDWFADRASCEREMVNRLMFNSRYMAVELTPADVKRIYAVI